MGGGGKDGDTGGSLIIPRGSGGWETQKWGLFRHCPLELRKTSLISPQTAGIRLSLLTFLLRYDSLVSECALQMGSTTHLQDQM